jgi:polyhydroxyalkanoate synthase
VDIVDSEDEEFRIAPGGHMGVILGSKAQGAVWRESADWLAERSA